MSEKRFELVEAIYNEIGKQQVEIINNLEKQILDKQKIADLLNEQQEEISYWKHRVSSLLWILGQFDEQKVKKLLEELDE